MVYNHDIIGTDTLNNTNPPLNTHSNILYTNNHTHTNNTHINPHTHDIPNDILPSSFIPPNDLNSDYFTHNILNSNSTEKLEYIQIGTLNICGKFYSSLESLTDLMFLQDIHILGITETRLLDLNSQDKSQHILQLHK